MQLFQNTENVLNPLERESFKLERDIQSLVERNMESLFGLEFVSTEFSIAEFRLDSLAFDEQNNAFVIVEYKKGHSYSVVDQGYSYLSVMLNNKADFILEYNEKTGKQLKRTDIDWTSSRVIFVSPSFNSYQKNSVNFKDVPFELWEIRKFEGDIVAFEQHTSSSSESIEKLSKGDKSSVISKVSSEVKVLSEEDHVSNLSDGLNPVWTKLREKLADYADTSFFVTKGYISWKRENTAVCFIHFRKKEFRIDILRGNIKENRSTKEGTVVTATGRAAEVAAGANTSHNCPTCAPTTSTSASTTSSATQTQVDKAGERITNSAINRFSYRIEQAINEGIDDLFYAR